MAMNVVVFCGGALGFWLCGYAIQNGFNADLFCLNSSRLRPEHFALFFFYLMYMDTAATIPTGAMAERWRFLPFVFFGLFMSMVLFPVYAQWVWDHDHGWLARLPLGHGVVDFAGSSVVHMVGGGAALVGAYLIGPRRGKFRLDGRPNPLPAHNVPMYMTGTLFLTFGWFGFNSGSALKDGDTVAAVVMANTILAAAAGAFASMTYTWTLYRKPDASFLCNGALAGLVAITAGCAYVAPWAAVLIGASAGILVIGSALVVERMLKIDDPVGAISVHGVSGAFGMLALGLFANGTHGEVRGLFYGDAGQLAAQLIGVGGVSTLGAAGDADLSADRAAVRRAARHCGGGAAGAGRAGTRHAGLSGRRRQVCGQSLSLCRSAFGQRSARPRQGVHGARRGHRRRADAEDSGRTIARSAIASRRPSSRRCTRT